MPLPGDVESVLDGICQQPDCDTMLVTFMVLPGWRAHTAFSPAYSPPVAYAGTRNWMPLPLREPEKALFLDLYLAR